MKELSYLIVLALILGLVLAGCSLLSNVGQVPATEQSGVTYLTKTVHLPDPGLVGLWRFKGDANDSSENGLNGTLSPSGASFVVDGFEQALNVDGTGWVQVTDSVLLEPFEITVEAWVKKFGSPGGAKYIVSKYLPNKYGSYSSYGLYTGSGGIRFYIGYTSSWIGSPQASAEAVWNGEWHHVAGTFDGVNIKLYLDGVQVDGATSTIQDIYYFGTGNLYIGAYTNDSYLAFSGTIDEVRIWSSALAGTQLRDMTPPVINITTPDDGATYLLNQIVTAEWSSDDGTGTGVASESETVPIDTSTVGQKTFTVTATDYAKNVTNKSVTYTVSYDWDGFFRPVDNLPTLNATKAGSAIPVKFSLSGYQGLNIFATGYPKSIPIPCDGAAPVGEIEVTVTAGGSSLNYDADADQYIYVWKTNKAWAGSCRQLEVKLDDGTSHFANFTFK